MTRRLLVSYTDLFPAPALPVETYLAGINRLSRLQCLSHLLGYLSQVPAPKRSHLTDMQQFFGPSNQLFGGEVYYRAQVLQQRVGSGLNFLHPKPVLQLYLRCFELPDEPETKSEAEVEASLFKACLVMNRPYVDEQYQAMTVAKSLLPTQPLAALALASAFSDFELINLRLLNIALLQLLKSARLFEFLVGEPRFERLLQSFLRQFKCRDWPDFMRKLSGITKPIMQTETTGRIVLEVPAASDAEADSDFLRRFALPEDQPLDLADFTSLRATPLVEEQPNSFVPVYPVLMLEIMHRGLYFQLSQANQLLPEGERIKDWRSAYCDLFSEQYLLYLLLDATFQDRGLALSGNQIKERWPLKKQAEPDYYFRNGNQAVLFESKDVLVAKDAKAGHDFAAYLAEMRKKFYEDAGGHPKAARQLATNVNRLLRRQLPFDVDFNPDELVVYPVLVVHDRFYNQPGLNVVVNDWFREELATHEANGLNGRNVRPLIIIDADTLLAYHEDFRDGRMVFEQVLEEYLAYLAAPARPGSSAAEEEQRQMQGIHPFALFLENYAEQRDMLGIPKQMLYGLVPLLNQGADE